MKTPNCEERIDREYVYAEECILKVVGLIEPDEEWLEDNGFNQEDRISQFFYDQHALSYDTCYDNTRGVTVPSWCYAKDLALSTGGPGDGFIILFDSSNDRFVKSYYYFQDWFDGALREVPGGSDLEKGLEILIG